MTGPLLVTGASGKLGAALVRALRAESLRVRALLHRRPVSDADEIVIGDLTDPASLIPAVADVDAIIHLAAVTHARSPLPYMRANAEGTRNLVAAARDARVRRFVHVSSRAIHPRGGWYSRSKAEAETAVKRGGIQFVIVRLPEVAGAGGREGVDGIAARARTGRPIFVVGDGSDEICPLAAQDIVAMLVCAAITADVAGRTLTLGGECTTVRAFAQRCVDATASRSKVVSVPVPLVALLARLSRVLPLPIYPDQLDRLRAPKPTPDADVWRQLGVEPKGLDEILRTVWPS